MLMKGVIEMKIIAWYTLILYLIRFIFGPTLIGKQRGPHTPGSYIIGTIVDLPLLYMVIKLVFGNIL